MTERTIKIVEAELAALLKEPTPQNPSDLIAKYNREHKLRDELDRLRYRVATVTDVMKRMQAEPRYATYEVSVMGWGMGNAQIGIADAIKEARDLGLVTLEKDFRTGQLMAALTEDGKAWVAPYEDTPSLDYLQTHYDTVATEYLLCQVCNKKPSITGIVVAGRQTDVCLACGMNFEMTPPPTPAAEETTATLNALKAQRLDDFHVWLRGQYLVAEKQNDRRHRSIVAAHLFHIETGKDPYYNPDAYEEFEETLHEETTETLVSAHESDCGA